MVTYMELANILEKNGFVYDNCGDNCSMVITVKDYTAFINCLLTNFENIEEIQKLISSFKIIVTEDNTIYVNCPDICRHIPDLFDDVFDREGDFNTTKYLKEDIIQFVWDGEESLPPDRYRNLIKYIENNIYVPGRISYDNDALRLYYIQDKASWENLI